MKFALHYFLSLLGGTAALCTPKPYPVQNGSFASTSGTQFSIDGQVGYYAGTNCYWCSFLKNSSDIDLAMGHIADSGLRILRVWGFSDVNEKPQDGKVWFQHLSAGGSTINTGADGLQVLDHVVNTAAKKGLKLVIPFVNYWSDYGGMNAYVTAFGGSLTSWYTNEAAQAQYRKYIQEVVGRYKNSNAIFAWELANEPRCSGCDTDIIYNWAAETSKFVKGLDPNHMVTLGDEGFGLKDSDSTYPFTFAEGTDFVKQLSIKTLDFGTFHMYPSHWGETYEWGNSWIEAHAKACAAAGKPCFFEEYGAVGQQCARQAPWQETSRKTKGMGADAFWQWGDVLSTGPTHDDDFTIFYKDSDWTCLVENHVAEIKSGSA